MALALGATLANLLCRVQRWSTPQLLAGLLLLAAVYLTLLVALLLTPPTRWRLAWAVFGTCGALGLALARPLGLPAAPIGVRPGDRRVLEVREGAHATVAAVEVAGGHRAIRVNTYYHPRGRPWLPGCC